MNIQDILPGNSYACKYLDSTGTTCIGVIQTRDIENQRVKIIDPNNVEIVLSFEDIWDVDTVEWSTK